MSPKARAREIRKEPYPKIPKFSSTTIQKKAKKNRKCGCPRRKKTDFPSNTIANSDRNNPQLAPTKTREFSFTAIANDARKILQITHMKRRRDCARPQRQRPSRTSTASASTTRVDSVSKHNSRPQPIQRARPISTTCVCR